MIVGVNIFQAFFEAIDKILFLEKCLACKRPGPAICPHCCRNLPRPEKDLPEYIYALYEYRNPVVKKILTDAKYRKKFGGLDVFASNMRSAMLDLASEYTELNNYSRIVIIPVPISRKRLKHRGFNQAELIAKEMLKDSKEFLLKTDIVQKIKDKTPQASIKNRNERLKSPVGSFRIKDNKEIAGALCIVIDDITTTGGTINEMRRILLESGARDVIGLAIAH